MRRLRRYAAPKTPAVVLVNTGVAWGVALAMITLVPFDVYSTQSHHNGAGIPLPELGQIWTWLYWAAFILTYLINPLHASYADAPDFTFLGRCRTSLAENVIYYAGTGAAALVGFFLLLVMHKVDVDTIPGLSGALGNAFGLVAGIFLLGHGVVEVPRKVWRWGTPAARLKWCFYQLGHAAEKVEEQYGKLSTSLSVVTAVARQIPQHDPVRPLIELIERESVAMAPLVSLDQIEVEEEALDYDPDEEGMAALRRKVRTSGMAFQRELAAYKALVKKAAQIHGSKERQAAAAGWREKAKPLAWKAAAAGLALVSVSILVGEATLSFKGRSARIARISLPSTLVKMAPNSEIGTQLLTWLPLLYICVCGYYSLCQLGVFYFYSLVPKCTDSYSLLFNASLVTRLTPALCYNYLMLTRVSNSAFETTAMAPMVNIPVLGDKFTTLYPMAGVLFSALIALSVWDRCLSCCNVPNSLMFHDGEDPHSDHAERGRELFDAEQQAMGQGKRPGEALMEAVPQRARASTAGKGPRGLFGGAAGAGGKRAGGQEPKAARQSYREKAAGLLSKTRGGRGPGAGSGPSLPPEPASNTWGLSLLGGRDRGGAGPSGGGKAATDLESMFSGRT